MELKDGYELVQLTNDGKQCGDGGVTLWVLAKGNEALHVFRSCHCGRGCGNKDCVRDDWGYHDCDPLIEMVRAD